LGWRSRRATRALILLGIVRAVACPRAVRAQTTEADFYVAQAAIDLNEKRYDAGLENLRRALALEPQDRHFIKVGYQFDWGRNFLALVKWPARVGNLVPTVGAARCPPSGMPPA
jgi:hypothetical protein